MSFLDNLESSLKNMESREERGAAREGEHARREADRARARAVGPLAEQLRRGPFTTELLNEVTRIAHGLRTKVHIVWVDGTLRLEAREHRLELRPTPDGVKAQFLVNKEPAGHEIVDLDGPAKPLAEKWLAMVGPRPAVEETS